MNASANDWSDEHEDVSFSRRMTKACQGHAVGVCSVGHPWLGLWSIHLPKSRGDALAQAQANLHGGGGGCHVLGMGVVRV